MKTVITKKTIRATAEAYVKSNGENLAKLVYLNGVEGVSDLTAEAEELMLACYPDIKEWHIHVGGRCIHSHYPAED